MIRSTRANSALLAALSAWLLTGLAGCATTVRPLPSEQARQQVTQTELAFARTMADRDLAAFGRFIADDAVFYSGKEPLRGRAAIVAAWAPFFSSAEAPFSWQPDRVEVSARGTLGSSSGPVYGNRGVLTGRFNSIWQRQPDGQWRIVFDSGSEP